MGVADIGSHVTESDETDNFLVGDGFILDPGYDLTLTQLLAADTLVSGALGQTYVVAENLGPGHASGVYVGL